jgi:SAM-dependent methyltransferase
VRPESYQLLADRQQTYWWHRSRRALALSLLRRYGLTSGCRWLDVGCGPGGNLGMLDPLRPSLVVGVDLSPIALSLAERYAPAATLVSADINERLPFADASFDVVTIFNVLYHQWVESEASVFAEVARVLRHGGLLLFTEPAFNVLTRELDVAVMTRRRYRITDFDPWLDAAAFDTLFSSYFTGFGFPILLAAKYARTSNHETSDAGTALDMRPIPAVLNETLAYIAAVEARALSRGLRMPFGTTLVRLARRRENPTP